MYVTASASKIVPTIGLVSMRVREMKVLNLGEESFRLGIHRGVGLIVGCEFGCVLGDGGRELVLADLEAHAPSFDLRWRWRCGIPVRQLFRRFL